MKSEDWENIERLYHAARELPHELRPLFLEQACAGDARTRRKIETLLHYDENPAACIQATESAAALPIVVAAGTKLGPYEIIQPAGAGAMGQVYRARDTRLNRDVAIKMLTEEFANDAERLARLERESRVLASLNHPNIASIYDVLESGGARYLVLEFVEGRTLADLLRKGALPVEQAVNIASDVAKALEAAHMKGVVHRDLKPANIQIGSDGTVKVLDFGLAKTLSTGADLAGDSNSKDDRIAGTPAYMSPEQLRGNSVDARADIWAFGCVFYEMLTGNRAFCGETVSDTVASILKGEPEWHLLDADLGSDLSFLLKRSFQKDPYARLQHTGDIRILLDEIKQNRTAPRTTRSNLHSTSRRRVLSVVVALLAVVAAVSAGLKYFRNAVSDLPAVTFQIHPPPGHTFVPGSFAVSPDGRSLAFVAAGKGTQTLWVRDFNSLNATPLAGTQGAAAPFWSPDSRFIGFASERKLKAIDTRGGAPRVVCDAPNFAEGAWGADDVIIFSVSFSGPDGSLYRTTATGGIAEPLTRLQSADRTHTSPGFLPDGRQYLFTVGRITSSDSSLFETLLFKGSVAHEFVQSVGSAEAARYAHPGYIVFPAADGIYAQAVDLPRSKFAAERVRISNATIAIPRALSVSTSGIIAYAGDGSLSARLVWFNRKGDRLGDGAGPMEALNPQLSPDEQTIAVERKDRGGHHVWLVDARGVPSRWTFAGLANHSPTWAPGGKEIVFGSNANGGIFDLYVTSATNSGQAQLLHSSQFNKTPYDWSATTGYILYSERDARGQRHLWALRPGKTVQAFPVTQSGAEEEQGQFSPDGRWIAYVSNETGQQEVFVQSFPTPTFRHRVSPSGGTQPRWRADGTELYYITADRQLVSVPMKLSRNRQPSSLEIRPAVPLFRTNVIGSAGVSSSYHHQYAVSSDGQRFLMNVSVDDQDQPITVILNWPAALHRNERMSRTQ